jgi:NAD(P)-dependent dehydrogenase (short-subunit alcohol dehydrogenase family)
MRKTVLITGSSTGFGRATAGHFADHGWNVVASMRRPGPDDELSRRDGVLVTRLDVQDSAGIDQAVQAGIDRLRYVTTDDILPLVKARRETSEEEYIAFMRSRFMIGARAAHGSRGAGKGAPA